MQQIIINARDEKEYGYLVELFERMGLDLPGINHIGELLKSHEACLKGEAKTVPFGEMIDRVKSRLSNDI